MDNVDGGCFGKAKRSRKSDTKMNENIRDKNANNNDSNVVAIAPVLPGDDYYKMDHEDRGLLIIFNHENFDANTRQPRRHGTDEDVKKIRQTFELLGFEIHPYKDMTLQEIQNQIRQYVKQDHYHKQRDCLVIFVLTHGDKDALWARDGFYNPAKELWGKFSGDKCPSLAGKPKLIFLQACQGGQFDDGVKLMLPKRVTHVRTETDGSQGYYKIPTRADFLIFYATFEGFFAFRNDKKGSTWVRLLCEELKQNHQKMEIQDILTFVNRRMAIEFSSLNPRDPSKSGKKQISYFKNSLTRLLVFGEKNTNIMDKNANTNDNAVAIAPILPGNDFYKMDHEQRGLLIIFNHENFDANTRQPRRHGTDEDVKKIKHAFEPLGFKIMSHKDMTLLEIQDHIRECVELDHKQHDCLAIFVLTHGDKDALWAKDDFYNPAEELWGKFSGDKCPSLAGKPKLIFLQACQGGQFDYGVKLMRPKRVTHARTETDGSQGYYKIPTYADFLIVYATFEGFYAFRNDVKGSFWVQLLCEEIEKNFQKMKIQEILICVNRRMAIEFSSSNSRDPSKSGKKQIPYFKNSLTRMLVFGKKIAEE